MVSHTARGDALRIISARRTTQASGSHDEPFLFVVGRLFAEGYEPTTNSNYEFVVATTWGMDKMQRWDIKNHWVPVDLLPLPGRVIG